MVTTAAVSSTAGPRLDRLDAYRLARQFHLLVVGLAPYGSGLGDQLRRASSSIVLLLAEGAGRVSAPDRARFFAMARASAVECAAILDLLAANGSNRDAILDAQRLLLRVIQTTTGLWRKQAG